MNKEIKEKHRVNINERFWKGVGEAFFRLNGFYQKDIRKYPNKSTEKLREMYIIYE